MGDTVLIHGASRRRRADGGAAGRRPRRLGDRHREPRPARCSCARYGATPVAYGPGLADRVRAIGAVDAALDLVGTDEALDTSVELVADRSRIATIAGFGRAAELGIAALTGADGGQAIRDAARPELIALAPRRQARGHRRPGVSARRGGRGAPLSADRARARKSRTGPLALRNHEHDDKMLARIAALLRQAEGTDNAARGRGVHGRRATAGHRDVDRPRRGPVAFGDQRTAAQAPTQRTITIGDPGTRGLRTYVQLFVGDRRGQRRASATSRRTRRSSTPTDSPRTSTPRHALYASLVVQMVRASRRLPRHRCAPAHPDDHRPAELPAGVRRPGRSAAGRGPRGGQAGGHQGPQDRAGYRNCVAQQGDRAAETTTGRLAGARHLAGRPAPRRATRRRRGGPVTAPDAGRGWVPAPSCRVPAAGWRGDGPRQPALPGVCRRGVRADAVRPRRRAQFAFHRLLRHAADASAGGPVRLDGVGATLRRRRARATGGDVAGGPRRAR